MIFFNTIHFCPFIRTSGLWLVRAHTARRFCADHEKTAQYRHSGKIHIPKRIIGNGIGKVPYIAMKTCLQKRAAPTPCTESTRISPRLSKQHDTQAHASEQITDRKSKFSLKGA